MKKSKNIFTHALKWDHIQTIDSGVASSFGTFMLGLI